MKFRIHSNKQNANSDFRGMYAAVNIFAGDEVLFVPNDLLVTLDKAKTTPIGAKMVEAGLAESGAL